MRRHLLIVAVLALALAAAVSTAAFAAGAGRGNPHASGATGNPHTSTNGNPHASGTSPSHDPSNPDGTYRGKSPSRPDQDGIGADHGIVNNDKSGPGTDGNNGCGNDPDREDDNNGWCGRRPAATPTEGPTVSPTATQAPPAEVLGERFVRPATVQGSTLARTGAEALRLVIAALVLTVMGLGIRAMASSESR